MQDNIAEQAENSASKIGKFNTADDLLAAYNALESEFTKRCQLIKQLQTELDSFRAQAADVQSAQVGDGSVVRAVSSEVTAEPFVSTDGANDRKADVPSGDELPSVTSHDVLNAVLQNAREYAELLCSVPEIMDACIASYKRRLLMPQPKTSPKGYAVIAPAKKPTTLSEAKRLADALLGNN